MYQPRSIALYVAALSIASSLMSANAFAWNQEDWLANIYVGADAQVRHMHFKSGYGHNLFRNDFGQGNVYIGLKLSCYAGIEVGYEAGSTKYRETTLTAGEVVSGIPVPAAASPATFRNKARVQGPHVDLMGYYSQFEDDPIKLIGSIGIAYAQGTFKRKTVQINNMQKRNSRIFSEQQIIPRVMGGVQYRFFDNWSARGTITWENTKALHSYSSLCNTAFTAKIKPEDSVIFGLGLVWNFN